MEEDSNIFTVNPSSEAGSWTIRDHDASTERLWFKPGCGPLLRVVSFHMFPVCMRTQNAFGCSPRLRGRHILDKSTFEEDCIIKNHLGD